MVSKFGGKLMKFSKPHLHSLQWESTTDWSNADGWVRGHTFIHTYILTLLLLLLLQQLFYSSRDFVQNKSGDLVPEETFTHSHQSSSSILLICFFHLLRSNPWHPPCMICGNSRKGTLNKKNSVTVCVWSMVTHSRSRSHKAQRCDLAAWTLLGHQYWHI